MVNGFICFFTETSLIVWIILTISLICLVSEIFIPSFGLVGIGGLMMFCAGVGINVNKPWLDTTGILWLIADTLIIFIGVIGLIKLIYYFTQGKGANKPKKQYLKMDGNQVPADDMGNPDFSYLKGKSGICVTDLKPSGKVEIDGDVYNVLSEKEYIYNGCFVRVIKTVGASIIVKKITE